MPLTQTARRLASAAVHAPGVKAWLRPLLHGLEDLRDGDVLERNRVLRNRHHGGRCFLVLTGASLNDMDVSALNGEWLFGCGRLHNPADDWSLRYHPLGQRGILQLSNRFGPKRLRLSAYMGADRVWPLLTPPAERQRKIAYYDAADRAYTDPECIFFLDAADRGFLARHSLLERRRVHYTKTLSPILEASVQTHDLTRRITLRDGSLFTMIAAAMYMGFTELYLCGAGYSMYPQDIFHFYGEPVFGADWTAARRQEVIDAIWQDSRTEVLYQRDDGNVVRPRWVRYEDTSDVHFVVNDYAASMGVTIANVVPPGFTSQAYAPVTWADVCRVIGGDRHDQPVASGGRHPQPVRAQ
jgi:hypothetical protein